MRAYKLKWGKVSSTLRESNGESMNKVESSVYTYDLRVECATELSNRCCLMLRISLAEGMLAL